MLTGLISFLPTLSTIFGGFFKALPMIPAFAEFMWKAITDAEATGQTGEQKLAAVLNDTQAYIAQVAPSYAAPFETIAADVEAVVGVVVSIANMFAKPPVKAA